MFAEERQEKILEMLKVNKRVSNTELIKKFESVEQQYELI